MGKTYKDKMDYEGHKMSPKSRGMLIAKLLSMRMVDNEIGHEVDRAWRRHMKEEAHKRDI